MTSAKTSCCVCGDAIGPGNGAECGVCGRPYHLNLRSDLPGKDCGDAWIDDERPGLMFACNACINAEQAGEAGSEGSLDDIIDAAEAALIAGISEELLVAAADAGQLAHRRTKGGVYLFERRTVVQYQRRP